MWSRGKGASRNFLPGFPLGQSMTYRLPVAANQAPGTAYTTTSQPSDGPLGVGLLAPGQSQQRKKKKKNTVEGGSRTIRTGHVSSGGLFFFNFVSTTTACIAVLTVPQRYSANHFTTLPIYHHHQTTYTTQCLLSTPRNSLLALVLLPRALFLRCPSNFSHGPLMT